MRLIPKERLELYKTKRFIVPNPKPDLTAIYEIDKLINLTGIRAEKWESIEWSSESESKDHKSKETQQTKPHGVFNPNYQKLTQYLDRIRELNVKREKKCTNEQRKGTIMEFICFIYGVVAIEELKDYEPEYLVPLVDVRHLTDICVFMDYLMTKYWTHIRLEDRLKESYGISIDDSGKLLKATLDAVSESISTEVSDSVNAGANSEPLDLANQIEAIVDSYETHPLPEVDEIIRAYVKATIMS